MKKNSIFFNILLISINLLFLVNFILSITIYAKNSIFLQIITFLTTSLISLLVFYFFFRKNESMGKLYKIENLNKVKTKIFELIFAICIFIIIKRFLLIQLIFGFIFKQISTKYLPFVIFIFIFLIMHLFRNKLNAVIFSLLLSKLILDNIQNYSVLVVTSIISAISMFSWTLKSDNRKKENIFNFRFIYLAAIITSIFLIFIPTDNINSPFILNLEVELSTKNFWIFIPLLLFIVLLNFNKYRHYYVFGYIVLQIIFSLSFKIYDTNFESTKISFWFWELLDFNFLLQKSNFEIFLMADMLNLITICVFLIFITILFNVSNFFILKNKTCFTNEMVNQKENGFIILNSLYSSLLISNLKQLDVYNYNNFDDNVKLYKNTIYNLVFNAFSTLNPLNITTFIVISNFWQFNLVDIYNNLSIYSIFIYYQLATVLFMIFFYKKFDFLYGEIKYFKFTDKIKNFFEIKKRNRIVKKTNKQIIKRPKK